MATTKTAKKPSAKAAKSSWTAEERAAMKERAKELKAGKSKAEGEKAVRGAIAQMAPADRVLAERLHAIILGAAPDLVPRTWYGMPAYAKDDEVICFFKAASKFKERYATFGFNTPAKLDEGAMWPTSFGLVKLTPADEKKIVALVKKAVS